MRITDDFFTGCLLRVTGLFVGEMCFLRAEVVAQNSVRLTDGEIVVARTTGSPGDSVTLTVRPEMLHLYSTANEAPSGRNSLNGSIKRTVFFGDSMIYEVSIGDAGMVEVRVENVPSMKRWDVGETVVVDFHPEAATALSE